MTQQSQVTYCGGVDNIALEVIGSEQTQIPPSEQITAAAEGSTVNLKTAEMGQKGQYLKTKGSEQSPLLQYDPEYDGDPTGQLKKNPTSFRTSQVILFLVFMVAGVALVGGLLYGVISFNTVEEELQQDEHAMVNIAGVEIEELDKSPVGEYRFAAVAADAGPCSTIGTNIMAEQRGSVVDAAIASLLCLGVHNAHSMGIGGGHFMMIYDVPKGGKKRKMFSLDARETAPTAASTNMYKNSTSSMGGLVIGVPGEIRGMHEAWKRFGRLSWKDLFEPTIHMCRKGYTIGPALGQSIEDMSFAYKRFSELGNTYSNPDGSLYKEGDVATRLKLADTLEIIAEEGPDAFYEGHLANDIYKDIQDCDGIITLDDLKDYKHQWRKPSSSRLRSNLTLHTMPAPSSGPVLQYMLNILEGFNFSKSDLDTLDKRVETYHRMIETMKFGYARRSYLGDPDFVDVKDNLAELLSKSFADHTRSFITDNMTHPVEYYHPANKEVQKAKGTSHLSLVGPDGGAVSVTSTINNEFGSKCLGSRTGIIFNDEMNDFSSPGDKKEDGFTSTWANFIEPGKRPLSSMVPSIFLDDNGEPQMVVGASGGLKILSTTTFVSAHTLFLGKRLNDAIDIPRLHHQLLPNEVYHADTVDENLLKGLEAKGHVMSSNSVKTATQGIWSKCGSCRPDCHNPCLYATCDSIKGGYPDGY